MTYFSRAAINIYESIPSSVCVRVVMVNVWVVLWWVCLCLSSLHFIIGQKC